MEICFQFCSEKKKYSYFFYVDFVSHPNKIEFSNSLRHLREIASFVRILGTYPKESEKSILDLSKNIIDNKLTIGILGFGRFGQFLGKELVKKFKVIATSRTNYKIIANNDNIEFSIISYSYIWLITTIITTSATSTPNK